MVELHIQRVEALELVATPAHLIDAEAERSVGLSAERAAHESEIRDDMMCVARRAGPSLRQLAEVSGLGRETVTAIVER